MRRSKWTGAVDQGGESFEVKNPFVADGSINTYIARG